MRYLVISSMRNEGAFLVEWLAWYRMLGFTDILVLTNDCTDRSPELLDRLAAAGAVTHVRAEVPEGQTPMRAKLRRAKRHRLVGKADWILVCDVDEFLVIHPGAGRIQDLLPESEAGFLGMSLNWRVFGTSGQMDWSDGLVHRQFSRCAPADHPAGRWFKAIFRRPDLFRQFNSHGPQNYVEDKAPAPWGEDGMLWVNADRLPVPEWFPGAEYQRLTSRGLMSFRTAQINHYIIRSEESFALKRGTLSASALKDRYNETFYTRFNRNEAQDLSALRYGPRFDQAHAALMKIEGVRRLHHLCCADYAERLARNSGRDPEEDARRRFHVEMAAA